MKKMKEAEAVYRQDLVHNPGNGWSTVGLHKVLRLQGKKTELPLLEKGYKSAFARAEQIPTASVY
jgi:hypothetical protein